MLREHHIPVDRTARYYALGEPHQGLRELWIVCHGYGQLAGRFLRHFEPIADPDRLVIAPEGLSRFYVETGIGNHAHAHVGASWMTREDRLSEIDDYIRYLDAVYAQLVQDVDRTALTVVGLGFSQGVATISRWLAGGACHVARAILWGAALPPDLDLAAAAPLRATRLTLVAGRDDQHFTPDVLAREESRLRAAGLAFDTVVYEGGHRIDGEVLKRLAESGAAAGEAVGG